MKEQELKKIEKLALQSIEQVIFDAKKTLKNKKASEKVKIQASKTLLSAVDKYNKTLEAFGYDLKKTNSSSNEISLKEMLEIAQESDERKEKN